MNINAYYKFIYIPRKIKSMRYDCIESTGNYEPFEKLAGETKDGVFYFYLLRGKPDTFAKNARRIPEFTISKQSNISGVYMPNKSSLKGFGDMNGTDDVLLFQFSDDFKTIEIFVSLDNYSYQESLFTKFETGQLDDEIERIKENISKPLNGTFLFKWD